MAYGDISPPEDTLEFDLTNITHPDMIHVSGDVYAIAYSDADSDGRVITIDIAADGQIGATVIDSLEFDTVNGRYPSIVHIIGDIYAIAYSSVDSVGVIVTVEITTAGQISAAVEDTLEFESGKCYIPDMIRLSSNMVA
ncbi:MAG: hypothetical protein U9Q35_14465, partial [Pseudomonadota bacterium]|nr:hypothetical protein [Pseudomonadota bacterium]